MVQYVLQLILKWVLFSIYVGIPEIYTEDLCSCTKVQLSYIPEMVLTYDTHTLGTHWALSGGLRSRASLPECTLALHSHAGEEKARTSLF